MIELRGVSLAYDDTPILDGVDLAVGEGELMLVTGPTGSGKSTLLGVLTGLVPRFTGGRLTGDVLLDGTSIVRTPPRERAHHIGYVGQDPAAGFVTDTVEEELAYGMEQLGLPGDTMRRRVEETLDLLGIAGLRARDLRRLSGGEQQRVALGSVLTMHPRILVLDEPTSALDPTAAEDVLATLTRLVHDLGVSVVLAEHRLERVVPFADTLVVLDGRGGLRSGAPAELLADSPVAPPLVELGRAAGWQPLPLTVRDARRLANGLRDRLGPPPADPTGPAETSGSGGLEARGVTVTHGATLAVHDVSLTLRPGTVTALMGRNGSGKSSLLWALQGSGKRRAGAVTVDGRDPAALDEADRRTAVGLVPQNAADLLYLETVADELAASGATAAELERLVPGIDGEHPPARPLRGTAAGPGPHGGAGRGAARAAAGRADARPRLRRQARPGRDPPRDGGQRARDRARGHPRRRVRGPGRRPRHRARRGRGRLVRTGTTRGRRVARLRAAGDQGPRRALAARRRGGGPPVSTVSTGQAVGVPLTRRSAAVLGVASLAGLVMLCWPLLVRLPEGETLSPPFLFLALLPLVIAVVLAEVSEGGLDPRALAILGVLSACNAVLRGLSAGTAGVELVFFLLILGGRVFGPGFGFALGCTSLFASALVTAGVGPWLPYQMLVSAWVGMGAGLLPRRVTGRAEIVMLAVYGVVAAYVFGLLMNLSGWPFALGIAVPGHEGSLDFVAGAPLLENLQRFGVYTLLTSTGSFDTGRAITTAVAIAVLGPAVLTTLASGLPAGLAAGRTRRLSRSVSALTVAGATGALSCCPVRARDGRISLLATTLLVIAENVPGPHVEASRQ